jgi:UDP-2,4-diacetamido-2,4,6-trideoxy-beta-L-altropyranose hydrolase
MKNSAIAIRVDASSKIGTGHVMRCLTLAENHRAKGARVTFICREHPGHLCDMVARKGFDVFRLEPGSDNASLQADSPALAHASWLGTSQFVDAAQTIEALHGNASWDWIIVDHYALDHRWESAMRKVANNIMVIDDLADRKHDCDILLDQNYFQEPEKRYESLLPEHCKTLLGPRYALLRPEFREAKRFCRMRGNGVARILVYFGGNDPDNLTGMALEALSLPELAHLLVEAVIGPNSLHQDQLAKQAKNRPGTRLHIQPENFTELMLRADLCLGAGGTTTWERLCLGLPSLVITVAENQEEFTKDLDKDGYITWVGRSQEMRCDVITSTLLRWMSNLDSDGCYKPEIVDGRGVERVTETIISSSNLK